MPVLFPWPVELRPHTLSFRLEANTLRSESPTSRAQQIQVRQGARWRCDMSLERRNRFVSARIDATLAALEGSAGEVYLRDFRREVPSLYTFETVPPEGIIQTLGVTAKGTNLLHVGGWPSNVGVMRSGDYFQLDARLYMLVADAVSDGSGTAYFVFQPGLRVAAANLSPVKLDYPGCRFRLADNNQNGNMTDAALRSTYNLSFVESLP